MENIQISNFDVVEVSDGLDVVIEYPDVNDNKKYVYVDQTSVRASDGIRIHYDYDLDGHIICQPVWDDDGYNIIEWRQVAFTQSWKYLEDVR